MSSATISEGFLFLDTEADVNILPATANQPSELSVASTGFEGRHDLKLIAWVHKRPELFMVTPGSRHG